MESQGKDYVNKAMSRHTLKAVFVIGGNKKNRVHEAIHAGLHFRVLNQTEQLKRFIYDAKTLPNTKINLRELFSKRTMLCNDEIRQYAWSRLGIIIDSVGWEFETIKEHYNELKQLGYDRYTIFVTTKDLKEKRYSKLFGNNFIRVNNEKDVLPQTWKSVVTSDVRNITNKVLNSPLENSIGRQWIIKNKVLNDTKDPLAVWKNKIDTVSINNVNEQ